MTQALAQLASAGGKVSTATGTITSSFNKLSGLGSKTASAIKKAAKGISSSLSQIGSSSKHLNTASFSFGKLLKSALPFIGFREIFNWGKQAVETASSLTEVQNVVDVAFGDMKQKVEDFASTSIEDFGMSELTAKEIASRYQAMGNAMGIPVSKFSQVSDILKKNNAVYGESVDSMADMSIELTKLAADMASFYDVNQEDVARNLYAVFTGEQEPLRKYGLDLTQATVQEWALKQGLDADMQSMTQAEKTLLRYQYVMSNSTAAMHDFQRTQDSWANQTRILSQRFQELGSVVGGTLINALKPLVKALNSVMRKVIEFARTVSEALGAIFGWKIEINTGGIANDLDSAETSAGDLADSADDAAGGFGDATGAAQKLKKTLSVLPFDELNQLASNLSNTGNGNSGSGSGSGGLDDSGVNAGAGASANLVQTDSLFERYKSEIETLEELGEYIGDALIKAMQSIDWESVYESARNFGTGLADFLNGLISPELFYETARLAANSINTAFYALNSFAREFDWTNLGNSISAGINSFFQNWNAGLTGATFRNFANGLIEAIAAAVDSESGIDWSMIGTKVRTMVHSALTGIKWEEAYQAAGNFGSGLATFLNNLITPGTFSQIGHTISGGLKTALSFGIGFISTFDWYNATMSLTTAITSFVTDVNWGYLAKVFSFQFKRALKGISDGIADTDWHAIGQSIADFITGIPFTELLSDVGELIWEAINAGIETFKGIFGIDTIEDEINGLDEDLNLSELSDGLKELGKALSPFVKGFAEGFIDVMDFLANTVTPAVISALGTAFQLLSDALNSLPPDALSSIGESLGEIGTSLIVIKGANTAITYLKGLFTFLGGTKTATDTALGGLGKVGEAIKNTGTSSNAAKGLLGKFWVGIQNAGATIMFQELMEKIRKELDGTAGKTRETDEAFMLVSRALINVGEQAGLSADDIMALSEPMQHLNQEDAPEFETAFQSIIDRLEAAGISSDVFKSALKDAMSGSLDISKEYSDQINAYINGTGTTFSDNATNIGEASTGMGDSVSGVGAMIDGLGSTASIVSSAKLALLTLAFGALQDSGKLSKDEMEQLDDALGSAGENGGDLTPVISEIKDVLEKAGISAGDFSTALLTSATEMKDQLPQNFEEIILNIETFATQIEENGKKAGENYPAGMADGITDNAYLASDAAEQMADDVNDAVATGLDEHSPSKVAEGYGLNYDQGFANGISNNTSFPMNAVKSMIDSIKNLFPIQNESFRKFGKEYAKYLKNGVSDSKSMLNDAAKELIEKLKEAFPPYNEDFYNFGYVYVENLANGINEKAQLAFNAMDGVVKNLLNAFGDLSSTLYYRGQIAAQSFARGISSVHIPMPHISVNASTRSTGSGYSYNMSSRVNWYKTGGLFSGPAVIGIGEAGKEVALPLENKRTMSMIADSIVSSSSGMGVDEEIMMNAVARGVTMAMMNNQQNSGVPEYIQNDLYLNGDMMARAVTKSKDSIDYRFNPTPQF